MIAYDFTGKRGDAPSLSSSEILELAAAIIKVDPLQGSRLIEMCGRETFARLLKPVKKIERMPLTGIIGVEMSVADWGEPKNKRPRADRDRARWSVTIQCFSRKSKGLNDPVWKGCAKLFTPARAIKDADRLSKPGKCLTPLSEAYRATIKGVAEIAEESGWLVGLLYSQPGDGGTYYHEGQVLLMSDPANGLPSEALVFDATAGLKLTMPRFSMTSASGSALKGNYVYQTRGASLQGHYANWPTGLFEVEKR